MACEERRSVERAASWRVDAQLQTQHVISAAAHSPGDARALADDDDWQYCNLQGQGRGQGTDEGISIELKVKIVEGRVLSQGPTVAQWGSSLLLGHGPTFAALQKATNL
jgi:hypothetical protein